MPLHLVYQLLHNGHTETHAIIMGSGTFMLLRKGLENMLFELLPNTDSGIFDHKLIFRGVTPAGHLLCLHKDGALWVVIFYGVINDIHQNLLQIQRISNHSAMLYIDFFQCQPYAPLLCPLVQKRDTVFQYIPECKRLLLFRRSSAVHLTELKHIVDHREQMLR